MTAVTDGAGPGRKDRSEGPPPHGGCPYRFAANGERVPRQNDGHRLDFTIIAHICKGMFTTL